MCGDPLSVCDAAFGLSVGRGAFRFLAGGWTRVRQTVVLNTPGKQDGGFTLDVNGERMIDRNDIFYRSDEPESILGGLIHAVLGDHRQHKLEGRGEFDDEDPFLSFEDDPRQPTSSTSTVWMTVTADPFTVTTTMSGPLMTAETTTTTITSTIISEETPHAEENKLQMDSKDGAVGFLGLFFRQVRNVERETGKKPTDFGYL